MARRRRSTSEGFGAVAVMGPFSLQVARSERGPGTPVRRSRLCPAFQRGLVSGQATREILNQIFRVFEADGHAKDAFTRHLPIGRGRLPLQTEG